MDIARQWLLSGESPSNIMRWMQLLTWVPFLCTLLYIILGFVTSDYWLLPYALFPIVMFFTANPLARKTGSYWIIGILVIVFWLIRGVGLLPPFIYWIPLLTVFFAMRQLYEGAADIAQNLLVKDEKALCFFWQWSALHVGKNDVVYSQKYYEKDSQTHYYQDIEKEWSEYVEM